MTFQDSAGVVLIHGFNGEPADMAYLHEYLAARGVAVYTLRLRGHGGSKSDMRRHGAKSWLKGVLNNVEVISGNHSKLYIVGFSMGGLLAVNLLQRFKVNKLVFVNTPIYFWNFRQILANVKQDIKAGDYANLKYYFSASHDAPLISLLNFLRMLYTTKPKLANVNVNTLILQNKDDDTVQPRSALYIARKIKGPKQLVWFKTGGHMMFVDERKQDAAAAIYTFLSGNE